MRGFLHARFVEVLSPHPSTTVTDESITKLPICQGVQESDCVMGLTLLYVSTLYFLSTPPTLAITPYLDISLKIGAPD